MTPVDAHVTELVCVQSQDGTWSRHTTASSSTDVQMGEEWARRLAAEHPNVVVANSLQTIIAYYGLQGTQGVKTRGAQEGFLCTPYRTRPLVGMQIGSDLLTEWFEERELDVVQRGFEAWNISAYDILRAWLQERKWRAPLCTFCTPGQSCIRHPFIPKP